ncbi:MAG: phosphoadenylyl-sulfate reductase [Rhizobiaceae bacterium]|nr:phosphoadenylyl-sulfate reductase [Rhizobiaceae bacterium]
MAPKPALPDAGIEAIERAADLEARYGRLDAEELIARAVQEWFPGQIGAVSSFGADSAVLLKLIANVDPSVPVVFLDTGKHFGETLQYRDELAADLGLTNLQIIHPLDGTLATRDPDGLLHQRDTTACCDIRKVEPMARAVKPYRAWFTGRKRFQAGTRSSMPVFEAVGDRVRINPMAEWTTESLAAYMKANDLRENPLVAYGYLSIGCFPCTQPVAEGEDARSGRWAGQAKTECGIHLTGLDASLNATSH